MLFPLSVESKPFYVRLVLRFSDNDTQLVLLLYPGGGKELVSSSVENMNDGELSKLISQVLKQNHGAKDEEIAAEVKIRTTRATIEPKVVERALNELRSIKISPFFKTRIAVDSYSEHDYWFDSAQKSVHYTILGESNGEPQDRLARWMINFQSNSATIVKPS